LAKEERMAVPKKGFETVGIRNTRTGIVVDREPFRVSERADKGRLQVKWVCRTSTFTVTFKNSPFAKRMFTSKQGAVFSWPVRKGVKADGPNGRRKTYKYTVTIGKRSIDPTGQVDP
jgi:hypothetical protein